MDLNTIMITGNLTADGVLRYTQNGTPIINIRAACNNRFNSNGDAMTDFFNVSIWCSAEHKDSAHFFAAAEKGNQDCRYRLNGFFRLCG